MSQKLSTKEFAALSPREQAQHLGMLAAQSLQHQMDQYQDLQAPAAPQPKPEKK